METAHTSSDTVAADMLVAAAVAATTFVRRDVTS
jgi:hypothetical protein